MEETPGAVVEKPGNAVKNNTGSWRTFRPIVDNEKCMKCGICEMYCPDRAIHVVDKKRVVIDYVHCKGCMVCAEMCPRGAIRKEREK